MRQSESSQHINPIQNKLPLQAHNTIMRTSNFISDNHPQDQKPIRRESSAQRQRVQVVIQNPNYGKPPVQHTLLPQHLIRSVESGYNSEHTVKSGNSSVHRSHSPSHIELPQPQHVSPHRPSLPLPSQFSTASQNESDKKGILYLNRISQQQRDQVRQTEAQQQKLFETSGLTRSSLEELYEEVNSLRQRILLFEQKQKKLGENEKALSEKERSIKEQLNKQKSLFEDYDTRIKALHITIQNYERRQKDLLLSVAQKQTEQERIQTSNNRLKVQVAELNVRLNMLEGKLRKSHVQTEDYAVQILSKLGSAYSQGGDLMRLAVEKVTEYAAEKQYISVDYQTLKTKHTQLEIKNKELEVEFAGLQAKFSNLEDQSKKKEEELGRTKEKVGELVSTFYSEMSKTSTELSNLKNSIQKLETEKQQNEKLAEKQKNRLTDNIDAANKALETIKKDKEEVANKLSGVEQTSQNLSKQLMLIKNSLKTGQCSCTYIKKLLQATEPDPLPQGTNSKLQQLLSSIFETLGPAH